MAAVVSLLAFCVGLAAVSIGVGLWSVPGGIVVAGAELVVVSVAYSRGDPGPAPEADA